jgi:hypothetical protein
MNCTTHNDLAAVAFCRSCGKPLCSNCTRDVRGVIYCEACLAARLDGVQPPAAAAPPQTVYQQGMDQGLGLKVPPSPGAGPNPALAGILAGFFPFGVGAVYTAQYAKGLAHLVIFLLMIVGLSSDLPWFVDMVLGISLAFFYVYQIIDASRSARAIQMGEPAPDPMGLAQTFGAGEKFEPGKVPVGAVVLIGMGLLFLLHTMGVLEFGFGRFWPLILIFLGGWTFYRHWERSEHTCTCGRCRTKWLMGPVMLLTTGVLFLLNSLDRVPLDRTWPAWLLVAGVVKLLQSSASSEGHVGPVYPAIAPPVAPINPPGPPPPGVQPPPSSGEVDHV